MGLGLLHIVLVIFVKYFSSLVTELPWSPHGNISSCTTWKVHSLLLFQFSCSISVTQLNSTITFHAIKGRGKEDEGKTAFFYWNFLGIPVFANNFMESKVRLNSVLEMYHCMEDCFCLGKQRRDRVALCLMCLLASHSTFNSSQNVLSH